MPFFSTSQASKKSVSEFDAISESHLRLLRRCRVILINEMDIVKIVESMLTALMSDDVSTIRWLYDVRDSNPNWSKEHRAGVFIDKLETKNDRIFLLFLEALNDHHRPLHSLLEETSRSLDEAHTLSRRDKLTLNGSAVRKLLQERSGNSRLETWQGSGGDSCDEFDHQHLGHFNHTCEESRYIDCYSVTTRGRLQPEKWIKHYNVRKTNKNHVNDKTYTAIINTDMILELIDLNSFSIDASIVRPPINCLTYNYKSLDINKLDSSIIKTSNNSEPQTLNDDINETIVNMPHVEHINELKQPPPVPPKPENLPHLENYNYWATNSMVVENECGMEPPVRTTSITSILPRAVAPSRPSIPPMRRPMPPLPDVEQPSNESQNTKENNELKNKSLSTSAIKKINTYSDEEEINLNYNVSASSISDLIYNETAKKLTANIQELTDDIVNENLVEDNGSLVFLNQRLMYSSVDNDKKSTKPIIQNPLNSIIPNHLTLMNITNGKISNNSTLTSNSVITNCDINHIEVKDEDKIKDILIKSELSKDTNTNSSGKSSSSSIERELTMVSLNQQFTPDTNSKEYEHRASTEDDLDVDISIDATNLEEESTAPIFQPNEFRLNKLPKKKNESSTDDSYYEEIEMQNSKLVPIDKLSNAYLDPCSESSFNDSPYRITFDNYLHLLKGTLVLVISDVIDTLLSTPVKEQKDVDIDHSFISDSFNRKRLTLDKNGNALYIPDEFLKPVGNPEKEPWFYPTRLSIRHATLFLLEEKLDGCFLIYKPPIDVDDYIYVLSVYILAGHVINYHIMENIHGDVQIEDHDHSFIDLIHLVEYFSKNQSTLATRLRRPLKYAKLAITPGLHYDSKYEIPRKDISLNGKIIGRGGNGVVCAGVYQGIPVAIKVLQKANVCMTEVDDFLEEATAMMRLLHDHVIRFLGICGRAHPIFIITELSSRGNLRDCLRNQMLPSDDIDTLFDICIQILSATSYLESLKFMLHRDLSARNFFVTESSMIKLSGFEHARHVVDDEYRAKQNENICIKWAAPEILVSSRYSTKSDVWAIGVVFWEIFSKGERPYSLLTAEQTVVYVLEGGRLDKPARCPHDLFSMMKQCWNEEPNDRPSFLQLYEKLKSKTSIYYCCPVKTQKNVQRPMSLKIHSTPGLINSKKKKVPTATLR